uniref:DDE Tnp4 domain-containing protein n=1 Tax=Culex tarsalis TaxID=7177 RepID=A0A1Q3EWG3_CULTA
MKFHNYSSPPEKGKTRSGTAAAAATAVSTEQTSSQLESKSQQQISLKKKITPEQLLQLQQAQSEPLAKRLRTESVPGEGATEEEEEELDTSATESETEMDQTATVVEEEEMEVSVATRLDASTLKAARGATTTILMATSADDADEDSMGRKKVKRKVAGKAPAANNTSTKAKLQMVHEFPTLFLGLRRNRIFLVNSLAQSFELNQRDIILTLRKIKLNEQYARLAAVFGLTDSEVEILFRTSVPKIADCLRNFIVWPDDITMKLNVPINLRQHFNKIHLILNYLVIKVRQNAVKHLSQAQTESSYCELDQCHKLKYLVASTLDGCVCFVSRGFGIQTDDEAVLAQSGFLTKFKTNTNLIAGKNFHNFEDRLTNGHDHENNNGAATDSDLERTLTTSNDDDNFEEIVSEKISKSRTFKLKNYIESVLESFQAHLILSPTSCVDGKTLELLDDVVVIVGALINLQKQEVE